MAGIIWLQTVDHVRQIVENWNLETYLAGTKACAMHYAFPRSKCISVFGGYIIQLNEFWILLVAVDELLHKFLL